MSRFLVAVRCFTYNQSKYIEETLNGFCMQQMNAPFVCLIVDDASTDGEQKVIEQYVERNFDFTESDVAYKKETEYALIWFARHKENKNCYFAVLFLKENHYTKWDKKISYLHEWRDIVKYEAWCEGDDCWTDSLKLQKQVDYLEAHPECVLVHTDMDVKDVSTGEIYHGKWKRQRNYNLINRDFGNRLAPLILQGKYSVTTLTVCVRRKAHAECIEEGLLATDKNLLMGDTTLWMALATKGSFHLIPESCACYHVLNESATHSKNYSNVINFYVSCLYMIELFSKRLKISEKDKKIAIQQYLFFLLRDVYTEKKAYLPELQDRILKNHKLSLSNSLLMKTMDCHSIIKKFLLGVIRAEKSVSHRFSFYLAKYCGIV